MTFSIEAHASKHVDVTTAGAAVLRGIGSGVKSVAKGAVTTLVANHVATQLKNLFQAIRDFSDLENGKQFNAANDKAKSVEEKRASVHARIISILPKSAIEGDRGQLIQRIRTSFEKMVASDASCQTTKNGGISRDEFFATEMDLLEASLDAHLVEAGEAQTKGSKGSAAAAEKTVSPEEAKKQLELAQRHLDLCDIARRKAEVRFRKEADKMGLTGDEKTEFVQKQLDSGKFGSRSPNKQVKDAKAEVERLQEIVGEPVVLDEARAKLAAEHAEGALEICSSLENEHAILSLMFAELNGRAGVEALQQELLSRMASVRDQMAQIGTQTKAVGDSLNELNAVYSKMPASISDEDKAKALKAAEEAHEAAKAFAAQEAADARNDRMKGLAAKAFIAAFFAYVTHCAVIENKGSWSALGNDVKDFAVAFPGNARAVFDRIVEAAPLYVESFVGAVRNLGSVDYSARTQELLESARNSELGQAIGSGLSQVVDFGSRFISAYAAPVVMMGVNYFRRQDAAAEIPVASTTVASSDEQIVPADVLLHAKEEQQVVTPIIAEEQQVQAPIVTEEQQVQAPIVTEGNEGSNDPATAAAVSGL